MDITKRTIARIISIALMIVFITYYYRDSTDAARPLPSLI
jgi:hypothetical protein